MNKIRTAHLLMIITLFMVIAFQFYWVRKLFNEENTNFTKTADITFKETLYKLQSQKLKIDTLLFKGLPGEKENLFVKEILSNVSKPPNNHSDSGKNVFIYINSTDTKLDLLNTDSGTHKITRHLYFNKPDSSNYPGIKKFTINTSSSDSITVKQVDSLYEILLKKTGTFVPYHIIKLKKTNSPINYKVHTELMSVGFFNPIYYAAGFDNTSWYILKKISFAIIFSVFLIALTALTFLFLSHNLLQQKRLNQIKNEFIGNITHELKTPIATVSVAIEAIKNFNVQDDPKKTNDYLDIASLELNRLSLLVDKVLKLSMFEVKDVEIKLQTFDLVELSTEVIKSMQLQFEKSNTIVNVITQGNDFNILADKIHITSVLYNLLDNALKYGGVDPVIELKIIREQKTYKIQISDQGTGIPDIYKDKVFEKFFRVPAGNNHKVKGYGLGLSYVAHIVKSHHGTIYITDNKPTGVILTINLPAHHAS